MFWKNYINWKVGVLYSVGAIIGAMLFTIPGGFVKFGLAEALQTAFFFLGPLALIIGGLLGKYFWKDRWFKIITAAIIIQWWLLGLFSYIRYLGDYLSLISFLPLPIVLTYLIYDETTPRRMRGLCLGFAITFWFNAIAYLITWYAQSPLVMILSFTAWLIPVGMIIGLLKGYGKKTKKQQPVQTQPQVQTK